MDEKYSAYEQSVLDYIAQSNNGERWATINTQRILCPEFKQYCYEHGNTPDNFTPVELRDMLLSLKANKIDSKRKWSMYTQYFRGYYNWLILNNIRMDNICDDILLSQEAYEKYSAEGGNLLFYSPEYIESCCGKIELNREYVEIIIRSMYEGVVSTVSELVDLRVGDEALNKASDKLKKLFDELRFEEYYYGTDGRRMGKYVYIRNYIFPAKVRVDNIEGLSEEEYNHVVAQNTYRAYNIAKNYYDLDLDISKLYQSGMMYRFIDAIGGEEKFCELVLNPHKRTKDNKTNLVAAQQALDEIGYKFPLKRFLFDAKIFAKRLAAKE